jgi:hypothetical protein
MIISLTTSPPLFRQQVISLSQSSCKSPVQLILIGEGGEGVGKEPNPNHKTARKPTVNHSILFGGWNFLLQSPTRGPKQKNNHNSKFVHQSQIILYKEEYVNKQNLRLFETEDLLGSFLGGCPFFIVILGSRHV